MLKKDFDELIEELFLEYLPKVKKSERIDFAIALKEELVDREEITIDEDEERDENF